MAKIFKLIFVSSEGNNNKAYNVEMDSAGVVYGHYGRVGGKLTKTKAQGRGEEIYLGLIAEKKKKGYVEVQVVDAAIGPKINLEILALKQIVHDDPEVTALIKYLVAQNKHHIQAASGGAVQVDTSGMVRTVTGDVLTANAVRQAMVLLPIMQVHYRSAQGSPGEREYIKTLDTFLSLVPQTVGRSRGWHTTFFLDDSAFTQQYDFLQALLGSAELYEKMQVSSPEDGEPQVFATTIQLVKNIEPFVDLFESSKHKDHSAVHKYQIVRVYQVHIQSQHDAYQEYGAKLDNKEQLWHGTMASNLLSILRAGYVVPSANSGHVTGRMFGPGAYFSRTSTKSLNYSAGRWCGSTPGERVFLLLNEVAVGNAFAPLRPVRDPPPEGYTAYNVEPGTAGVRHHECIVPRVDQVRIVNLLELA